MKHEKKGLMVVEHLKWKDDTLGVTERRANVLHRGVQGVYTMRFKRGWNEGANQGNQHSQIWMSQKKITKQQSTENLNVKIHLNKNKCKANGVFICW